MDDHQITLRSYRLAFDLERRLHRIDRFRIPLPYGVPLTTLGYASAALLAVLVARQVPIAGALLASLPLPIQLVLLPGAAGFLAGRVRPDGRPAHEAAIAWLLLRASPSRLVTLQPVARQRPEALEHRVPAVGDERDARLRAGRLRGPAVVLLGQQVSVTARGRRVHVQQLEHDRPLTRPRELRLGECQVLVIE
jgi:hypothetical protein